MAVSQCAEDWQQSSCAFASLPSRSEIITRFGLQLGADPATAQACWHTTTAGGVLAPCTCAGCSAWKAFLAPPSPSYSVWTRETVRELGSYLQSRIAGSAEARLNPVVLEIACGDGRLTAALRGLNLGFKELVATDSGRNAVARGSDFPVVQMDAEEALRTYKPWLVICSWMPLGVDLAAAMRRQPSVQEYVLVGDPEICGLPFQTWGRGGGGGVESGSEGSSSSSSSGAEEEKDDSCERVTWEGDVVSDGRRGARFRRVELPALRALLIGRTDERWSRASRSRALSFRRLLPAAAAGPGAEEVLLDDGFSRSNGRRKRRKR